MQKDIFPQADNELKVWLNTFKTHIATQGPLLGLSAAEVSHARDLCTELSEQIEQAQKAKSAAKSANAKKKDMRKTHTTLLRSYIRRIKANTNYTQSNGKMLNVVNGSYKADPSGFKPQLKAYTDGGMIAVKFKKYGMERFEFYGRRDGDEKFQLIGSRSFSPFYFKPDALPGNPAQTWDIKAIAVVRDEHVGEWSSTVQVLFKPL